MNKKKNFMKEKVAILARKKSDCISLLNDLKLSGISRSEVFFSWEDLWLSEQKNGYDFVLIDYCFFDMFRDDIVVYHLFHKYKFKITFYSNISNKVKTQKGNVAVDLYRMFFRPFVDFDNLIKSAINTEEAVGIEENTLGGVSENEKALHLKKNTFFLKEGYSLIKFNLNEVLCLESDRNYITVYLSNGKHLIRETLQSVLGILPNNFLRINRSVIINIDKVYKIVGNRVHINGLNSFRPVIANKYKLDISNSVPMFSQKHTVEWNYNKKEKTCKN